MGEINTGHANFFLSSFISKDALQDISTRISEFTLEKKSQNSSS